MSRDLKIKAGTMGLILSLVGTVGRIAFVATRPGGLHPIEVVSRQSSSQTALAGLSALLVLVGGLIGVYAAIKNEGRAMGLVALALTVTVFILMFTTGVI